VVPADPAEAGKLAARYRNGPLGGVTVVRGGAGVIFDMGEWRSHVASRKNDDGTISFITVDPCVRGFEFVVGEKDGKRALFVRDAQHEYVFLEIPAG
jgi:extradiol dioxygenase family protein